MAAGSRTAAPLACALVVAALGPVAAARAATVRVGRQPARPAGARLVGAVPAATPMHVTVALRPRDPWALAAYARAVSTPGSDPYRHYLTPAQFARRFGATAAQVRAVRRSLRARGLDPGALSRGALSISVTATAAQLERAFSVSLHRMALPGRRVAIASSAAPAVPGAMAWAIQGV
ncbi:MAG: protease pro-enzyme activation domain-containing protein, partial [Solirubrobacteraceae bacterium]